MSAGDRPYLTVVSGAPRSGTSLMMRMLVAGGIAAVSDEIRAADTDNPNGYFEYEPVKTLQDDATWVAGAVGRAVKMVYVLLRDLPPDVSYRVLVMRRDLGEVVRSQNKMLARLGRPPRGIPDERVVQMFEKHLADTESWLAAQPSFSSLSVDYNALVADPRPGAEAVAAFLGDGSDLDIDAMCAVVDPALYRNRG